MNKRIIILFILLFALLSPLTVLSDSYRVIIDDSEDLLTPQQETVLKAKMEELTGYGNVGFFTVSQYGSSTSTYAKKLYRDNFGHDSGIIFVIDMGRRNIWIYSDGAIYRVINKAYANTITDNTYRYASRGEYYECAYNVFDQAKILLQGGRISQPMKYISNALIALVGALLLNFFYLSMQSLSKADGTDHAAAMMTTQASVMLLNKTLIKKKRHRHVDVEVSSGSGGGYSGGGGGGGFSGGGGGGSSGGGGGHSF